MHVPADVAANLKQHGLNWVIKCAPSSIDAMTQPTCPTGKTLNANTWACE